MKYTLKLSYLFIVLFSFAACQAPAENAQLKQEDHGFEIREKLPPAEEMKRRLAESKRAGRTVNVKELTGRWFTTLLDVRMESVKGIADSTSFISARTGTFVDRLGIKQMEYNFRKNGAYNILYRDRGDMIVRTFGGNWRLDGSTLVMDEISPKKSTYYYEFTAPFEEDYQARLRGVLDYDYDGEEDDKVIMVLEKMKD